VQSSQQDKMIRIKLVCIAMLIAVIFSGCQLSYNNSHSFNLTTEYVLIDKSSSVANLDIDNLVFSPFYQNNKVPFDTNTKLLLKINLTHDINAAEMGEYTLSVFPKYLKEVHHFQEHASGLELIASQHRIQTLSHRTYSSQRFAFNIDNEKITDIHYLLIDSDAPRYVNLEMFATQEYTRVDSQHSHFFTFVYSLIFAMAIFNAVFYFYNREKPYLLYTLYMLTSLNVLMWQEGKINDLPVLAWQIIGPYSSLAYIFLNTLTGTYFFYNFLKLSFKESWLVKILLLVIGMQAILIAYTLVNYHVNGGFDYKSISSVFNLSTLTSSLLILLIIIIKTIQKAQQAKYLLVAWGIMISAVVMRIYFAFDPRPELIWMAHSYELAVMIEGLILAFAIGNRSMEFKKQRDQAVNKYSKAERSIFKHQLLNEFQSEMQKLAKDSTLSAEEVAEKTNIKFHLLLTRAFPIKNSLILEGEQIKGICTTGIDVADIGFLKKQAIDLQNNQESSDIEQKIISMSGDKQSNVLFIPLKKQYQDKVTFILTLKNHDTTKPNILTDLQKFCGQAYNELLQAKEMYQVALAANMDSLTQCYNRSSIESIIQLSLKQKKVTTVAYVDLDNLKHINDKYGHQVGDQCIIDFAHLLEENLSPSGKVGRIGGDEFLAVFSGFDFDTCLERLETFMDSLQSLKVSEHQLVLTCSIGMAESRMKETTRSLIKKADKALYHSKEQGRNQLTIYESTFS
jgi:diguanylate cyclase (GGDEF)-like protein